MGMWLKAALVRAIKTFAQAMVAQIGAGTIGITEFDWLTALSISAMAAVLSILTSIAGLPEVDLYYANLEATNEGGYDSEPIEEETDGEV